MLIVITGLDGSGTSTIGEKLHKMDKGSYLFHTPSEIYGDRHSIDINARDTSPQAHYLYYLSSVVYMSDYIKKNIDYQNHNVYCVRYLIDTVVSHRVSGLEVDLDYEKYDILEPELTIFVELDENIRQERITNRGKSELDKVLDNENIRKLFLKEFQSFSENMIMFNNGENRTDDRLKNLYHSSIRGKMDNILLSDEKGISNEDYEERKVLIHELEKMPIELFAKMRHFQPQIGCLNACRICSKFAKANVESWNEKRIRNVIAAIKCVVSKYRNCKPYIVWDREEHRNEVIFSYLDNDIGNYIYLYEFIKIAYEELGVKTRISTVGFSRHNEYIVRMHERINSMDVLDALGGVRLSFTPYEIGWEKGQDESSDFSRTEYIKDMAEFLRIYRPYYNKVGSGSRNMCVELRYKPLAILSEVIIKRIQDRFVILAGSYLYISCQQDVNFKECKINDPKDHNISLTEKPIKFYEIVDYNGDKNRIIELVEVCKLEKYNVVDIYMFVNAEGEYYAINPQISSKGNYGINIYPKTKCRSKSGYIITERFFLNALLEYKMSIGLGAMDIYNQAKWSDVEEVISICKRNAGEYKICGKVEKSEYIECEVIPMIEAYICALKLSGYSPCEVFDPNFTIDTGIICNMGRSISEFKGLTEKRDEPLTPTHERNYGKHNSTMTVEGEAWRLSCDYNDKIIIEKLSLRDTASIKGQVRESFTIGLKHRDNKLNMDDLKLYYLVPGQKRIVKETYADSAFGMNREE